MEYFQQTFKYTPVVEVIDKGGVHLSYDSYQWLQPIFVTLLAIEIIFDLLMFSKWKLFDLALNSFYCTEC